MVADEVRALAKRTQDSIAAIEATITSLQLLAHKTVENVNNSSVTTEHAGSYITAISKRLRHTEELEDSVALAINQIASAMEEQSAKQESMELCVEHLRQTSSTSLQELQQIVTNLNMVVDNAHKLTELLANFKLK